MTTVIRGIEAANPFEAADRRLMTELPQLIGAIPLAEVIAPIAPNPYGRPAQKQPLELYQLVPLVTNKDVNLRSTSSDMTGPQYVLPEGVQEDYWWNGPNDVGFMRLTHGNLDARGGAGLVFRGMLIAVGAGYVRPHLQKDKGKPELVVNQLQGWVHNGHHAAEFTDGLRGGFQWRDTLLHVWEHVAVGVGAAVISTPDKDNHPYNIDHGPSARRRGFTHNAAAGLWEKALPQPISAA